MYSSVSILEVIVFQFKEAGRNEAMRFVFPLSVPEGTKTGSNLNAKLKGIFDTTSTACLKEDGTVWIEAEDLIKPEDKKRSKLSSVAWNGENLGVRQPIRSSDL